MSHWDKIGKDLLRSVVGDLFTETGSSVEISLGPEGGVAKIGGTIGGTVAVEIESRTPKQIRGAVLDLILHPFPKKLLFVLPVHVGNRTAIGAQARYLLGQFLKPEAFRVVVAPYPDLDEAVPLLRAALRELGVFTKAG
jgi:hypothetical protein